MFRLRRQLRSNDFDVLGHLNQSIYHVLLEDVRVAFVATRLAANAFPFVIVRTELDHRAEVQLGNTEVDVELGLDQIGESSFVLDQRVIRLDGVVAAEGKATFVCWDPERRTGRPLTDTERTALQTAIRSDALPAS